MAQQTVDIYFKVEGLDGYIQNLDDLKSALGGVEKATDDVTQATEELADAERDFEKLESRLETTEGAVKVLAGSFEILAGAASLLGVEDNEFFKELEENVVGVISLAEGAVNVAEGMKLLAQNQRLAAVAQRIFNTVAKANPYVLLATSIIALVGAIAAYVTFTKEEAIPTEEELAAMREKNAKKFEEAKAAEERAKEAEQARIQTLQDLKDKLYEVSEAENKKNDTTLDGVIATNEALQAELERELEITDTLINATRARVNVSEEELQRLIDQGLNLTEEEQGLYDLYQRRKEQTTQVEEVTIALNEAYKERNRIIAEQNMVETEQVERMELVRSGIEKINDEIDKFIEKRGLLKGSIVTVGDDVQNETDGWLLSYKKAFDQFREEPQVWADMLRRDVSAAFDFANNLNTIFEKDSEERARKAFNLSKALSLTNAVINTAEGITAALTDKTQPSTILRILQTAAVAAAGAAQIATISRQKFEPNGGGNPPPPPPPNPRTAIDYSFSQQAGQITQQEANITPIGQGGPGPVRAYVIATEVTNAQEANAQIENLARL